MRTVKENVRFYWHVIRAYRNHHVVKLETGYIWCRNCHRIFIK